MSDVTNPTADADPASEPTQELAPEDLPEAPATETTAVEPAPASEVPAEVAVTGAAPQVVYVHAPVPPKVRHNRLFGALIALLGGAVFAAAFFAIVAVYIAITPHALFESTVSGFVNSSAFWVPVLFYVLAAVLVAIVLNRAAAWTHIIGSIVVAVFVYWASAGVITLIAGVITMTPEKASLVFWTVAGNPIIFIAAILAREVSLWLGLLTARRGARVRALNAEAKAAYDAEQAEKKAEYERAAATV